MAATGALVDLGSAAELAHKNRQDSRSGGSRYADLLQACHACAGIAQGSDYRASRIAKPSHSRKPRSHRRRRSRYWLGAGLAVWLAGITFEVVGDWATVVAQLTRPPWVMDGL